MSGKTTLFGKFSQKADSIGANRPGTVPDLEALSLVPPGKCYLYLKCPRFSRFMLLSWVQTSSTTLELWVESLNHVSFIHSAVYLVAMINCFAVLWVGLSSKIIYWACAWSNCLIPCNGISPPFFCLWNYSLEVGTYEIGIIWHKYESFIDKWHQTARRAASASESWSVKEALWLFRTGIV